MKKGEKKKMNKVLKTSLIVIGVIVAIFILLIIYIASYVFFSLPDMDENFNSSKAIVIQAQNENEGVAKEYDYLKTNGCLNNGGGEKVLSQTLKKYENNMYDIMKIQCNDGQTEVYYFQIDSFFGKT